jgi:predicted transglutaminase-like cysteine proteinase
LPVGKPAFSCFSRIARPTTTAFALAAVVLSWTAVSQAVQASAANVPLPSPAAASPGKAAGPAGIFGSLELRTNAARGAQNWPQVMSRVERERALYRKCDAGEKCHPRLRAWRSGLKRISKLSRWQQIDAVNKLANRLVRYRSDRSAFGRADYWASPAEVLAGQGDCEDYAILKYVSLRELGFAEDDMRLVVLRDTRRRLAHAVLAVNFEGGRYILDNLLSKPVEHTQLKSYKPVYSVNDRGQWLALQVRKTTTQVASLSAVLPAETPRSEPKANNDANGGLKLPETAVLEDFWRKPISVELPRAGWGYAFAKSFGQVAASSPHSFDAPQI